MRGLLAGRRETMNYKIEKNTVQETLIIPLYARKMCSELYPNLYRDEAALRLVGAVDYALCSASAFWRLPCGRTT